MVMENREELIHWWEHYSYLQQAFHLMVIFSRTIQNCLTRDFFFFLPLGLRGHLGDIVWNFPTISVLCERQIWSQYYPGTSTQHRQAGWEGAGWGLWGAVAMATQPAFQNNVSNQENSSRELSLHNPQGQLGQGMHKGDSFFVEKWLFTRPRTKENICCIGSVFVVGWNKINTTLLLSSSALFIGNEFSFVT